MLWYFWSLFLQCELAIRRKILLSIIIVYSPVVSIDIPLVWVAAFLGHSLPSLFWCGLFVRVLTMNLVYSLHSFNHSVSPRLCQNILHWRLLSQLFKSVRFLRIYISVFVNILDLPFVGQSSFKFVNVFSHLSHNILLTYQFILKSSEGIFVHYLSIVLQPHLLFFPSFLLTLNIFLILFGQGILLFHELNHLVIITHFFQFVLQLLVLHL